MNDSKRRSTFITLKRALTLGMNRVLNLLHDKFVNVVTADVKKLRLMTKDCRPKITVQNYQISQKLAS